MLIKDPFGIHGIKALVQDTGEALDYKRFSWDSPAWYVGRGLHGQCCIGR